MKQQEWLTVDLTEQTPNMLISSPKTEPLYEAAYLSREERSTGAFQQNTTVWD
ncbi:MAG: hypothetical protein IJU16_04825 [Clostridia bacterium]|nr:hypothetical protein [Clostridia bacterium]